MIRFVESISRSVSVAFLCVMLPFRTLCLKLTSPQINTDTFARRVAFSYVVFKTFISADQYRYLGKQYRSIWDHWDNCNISSLLISIYTVCLSIIMFWFNPYLQEWMCPNSEMDEPISEALQEGTCSLVPQKKKIGIFLCSPKSKPLFSMFSIPQNCICCHVPFSFRLLFPCSPEIKGFISLFPKTPGSASFQKVRGEKLRADISLYGTEGR